MIRFRPGPLFTALFIGAAVLLPARSAAATAEEAAAGRALLARYSEAIIGVEMVVTIKMTIGDRAPSPREQKREINGTVIAPNGLTVIALSSIDPRLAISAPPNAQIDEPEFKEVKLRLADGAEIAAQVVLKDEDLDLAFIAPEPEAAAGREFPSVNLREAAEPEVLGNYYALGRASKALQRAPEVRLCTLSAVIEKPRRVYLATEYAPSCPLFDAEGRVLGIIVRHLVDQRASGFIVLPARDIADIAPTAP